MIETINHSDLILISKSDLEEFLKRINSGEGEIGDCYEYLYRLTYIDSKPLLTFVEEEKSSKNGEI